MTLEDIYRPVERELGLVERSLREISRTGDPAVSEAITEILGAGGKRLRPALLLIAARGCGYSGERSINLAVAIELVHTASLIHDDVIDRAAVRRSAATVNSRWGNRVAVLLGDYLYAEVVRILAEDGNVEIMRNVAVTTSRMTRGEIAQTLARKDLSVTEGRYLSMIAEKTAALISCSCRVGALLGERHNGEVEVLADYGLNLGMAFQIADDLLDLTGEQGRLGKVLGNDIREGRLTLPVIHAMSVASEKDGAWLGEVLRSGRVDDGVLERIREVVERYQGIEYSRRKAMEYGRACKERLKALEESESQTALAMLADYVVARAC